MYFFHVGVLNILQNGNFSSRAPTFEKNVMTASINCCVSEVELIAFSSMQPRRISSATRAIAVAKKICIYKIPTSLKCDAEGFLERGSVPVFCKLNFSFWSLYFTFWLLSYIEIVLVLICYLIANKVALGISDGIDCEGLQKIVACDRYHTLFCHICFWDNHCNRCVNNVWDLATV